MPHTSNPRYVPGNLSVTKLATIGNVASRGVIAIKNISSGKPEPESVQCLQCYTVLYK